MNPVIQSSTAPSFSGFATSHQIPIPSGLAVGDLWICYVHFLHTSQTITIPAGWITFDSVITDYGIVAIYRIATSGDVASGIYHITYSAKANAFNTSLRITGFDPVTPLGIAQHDSIGGVFYWPSSTSVVPAKNTSLVLFSFGEIGSFNGGMGNAGDTAFGNPEGTITNVQSFGGSSGGFNSGCIVYDNRLTTASTNGWSLTVASNFADWVGSLVVVNPAVAGGGSGNFFPFMT